MKRVILFILLGVLPALVACGGDTLSDGPSPSDHPARAVEDYLSAKVRGDADAIRAGLCSEMEAVLERELRTFESVSNATIENMSCASDDPAAGAETVARCEGRIVALYGTEQTTFPLSSYRVVKEDGEWKWCGEAQ